MFINSKFELADFILEFTRALKISSILLLPPKLLLNTLLIFIILSYFFENIDVNRYVHSKTSTRSTL